MTWSELNGNLWVIPGQKTKNRQEHKVPLSVAAQDCLQDLQQRSTSAIWVFPSPMRGGSSHFKHLSGPAARLRNSCEPKPEHFTPHDLRRTVSTQLSKIGVDDVLIAKILNHKWADKGSTSVYNRWEKLPEMRLALERWSSRLEQIAAGRLEQIAAGVPAKVVKIR
jgi:integrase